jgi:hypothetical protein
MPKTPVDEDGNACCSEDDIGRSRRLWNDAFMQSETQTQRV